MNKSKDYIYVVTIMVISVLDILYGIHFYKVSIDKVNNRIDFEANIHQYTNNHNSVTLYVDYIVDTKEYNSVIITNNIPSTSHIKIYCNKNNLTECVIDNKKNTFAIYVIVLGIVILLADFIYFMKKIVLVNKM